jgi:hypothetical protein
MRKALALSFVLAACGDDRGPGTDGSASGVSAETGGDGESEAGSGELYDTPPGETGDGDEGCTKVDFLFVVDRSSSMSDEQLQLVASFPGFIDAIRNTVQATDYHILVADTDDVTNHCWPGCEDNPFFNCQGLTCDKHQDPSTCDGTLGAGLILDQILQPCGVAGGARYMTEAQPDLEGTFACVAEVGIAGSLNETQGAAVVEAVGPGLSAVGACNEGFLRDDAILVVTLISDENDMYSPGEPAIWHQAIVDAKHGNDEAVVFLGLVGDTEVPGGLCHDWDDQGNGARDAPALRELAEAFTHGTWASVCEPDYTPFFLEAVSVIDTACDEFVPEG